MSDHDPYSDCFESTEAVTKRGTVTDASQLGNGKDTFTGRS
jgi:hypothetical protein